MIAKWFYLSAFVINAVLFLANFLERDTHDMIFHGFAAAIWYACAERSAK
ncbi:hypothetical protein [Pseudarthrobacter cellobiosi]|nr:hypothetical protein [Pseudarthrobacter sp. HLT1-5]MCO4257341.1 hypothetical protein [Pseudarthrobacter sp. HLT1-5]